MLVRNHHSVDFEQCPWAELAVRSDAQEVAGATMPGTGRIMIGGDRSSLPAKLALLVTFFSLSLMGIVLRVHRTAFFSSIESQHDEESTKDAPRRQLDSHKYNEEEEEENENRPPMNIVLFYADDWRHDTVRTPRFRPDNPMPSSNPATFHPVSLFYLAGCRRKSW